MSQPTPLLHGSTPWHVANDAVAALVAPYDGTWAAIGERLAHLAPGPAETRRVDDPGQADLVVAAPAPGDLDSLVDSIALATDSELVVVDLRVPGWSPTREVQHGPHVFHVYAPPTDAHAASFDEGHQLAVVHPRYDGFLVTTITARRRIEDLRLVVEGELVGAVTPHHLEGPLARGQQRAVDIELHPGVVPDRGLAGQIALFDGEHRLGPTMQLTLATSPAVEAVLAGELAGPLSAERFTELVDGLRGGELTPRKVARIVGGEQERTRSWRPWRRTR